MIVHIRCRYQRSDKTLKLWKAWHRRRMIRDVGICIAIIYTGVSHILFTVDPPKSQHTSVILEQRQSKSSSDLTATITPAPASNSNVMANHERRMVTPSKHTCVPVSAGQIANWVEQSSRRHGVNASLILTVMFQESRLDPCSQSPKGAKGLMQLMPATSGQYLVSDPFDAKSNIDAGAHLLKDLALQFHGDLRLVLAAYNAGPVAVNRVGRDVPHIPETERYVDLLRPTSDLITGLQ